jgi:hypothetical protein
MTANSKPTNGSHSNVYVSMTQLRSKFPKLKPVSPIFSHGLSNQAQKTHSMFRYYRKWWPTNFRVCGRSFPSKSRRGFAEGTSRKNRLESSDFQQPLEPDTNPFHHVRSNSAEELGSCAERRKPSAHEVHLETDVDRATERE